MTRAHVGIVSWNTAGHLDACLAALPAALAGTECRVTVVDNASTDASRDVAAGHAGVEVIDNDTNVGYARAMNQALGAASPDTDVLIALNPDAIPPPGSLTELVRRLVEDVGLGLVAPRLVGADGRPQHSVYRFPSPAVAAAVSLAPQRVLQRGMGAAFWLEGWTAGDASADIDWAIGAVHVVRAEAVDRAHVYNDRWFMYAEDLDLCWQLASRGWRRRLEADVTVVHAGNVAGARAWGDSRRDRWQWATYDWYRLRRGAIRQRTYAAVNAFGVVVLLTGTVITRALHRPGRRGVVAHDLRTALPLHLRALVARDIDTRARGGPPA